MTTSAMVLGAVPLVLASGAGAESRMQIGWVVAGGMMLGTLLTLFVVPCAYSIMGRTHAGLPTEETKPEILRTKPIAKAAE
jgi:multidrug efflux pump